MTRNELINILKKYVPEGTEDLCVNLLIQHKIQLKLTKPRTSKYGDYRAPHRQNNSHRISINHNLNPYSFLTTFLHEVAHLTTFEKYKNRCEPHGKEWKNEFKNLLEPLVNQFELPKDIQNALKSYMLDPAASSCSDKNLVKVLSNYDKNPQPFLEDLPLGAHFKIDSGKVFRKSKKLRAWYQCFEIPSGKEYRISGVCKVEQLSHLD